jgi:hypothetical protein
VFGWGRGGVNKGQSVSEKCTNGIQYVGQIAWGTSRARIFSRSRRSREGALLGATRHCRAEDLAPYLVSYAARCCQSLELELAEISFCGHRETRSNSKRHKELGLRSVPRSKGRPCSLVWCDPPQAFTVNLNILDKRARVHSPSGQKLTGGIKQVSTPADETTPHPLFSLAQILFPPSPTCQSLVVHSIAAHVMVLAFITSFPIKSAQLRPLK